MSDILVEWYLSIFVVIEFSDKITNLLLAWPGNGEGQRNDLVKVILVKYFSAMRSRIVLLTVQLVADLGEMLKSGGGSRLYHFFIHPQQKNTVRTIQKDLNGLEYLQHMSGQAAVQVINDDYQRVIARRKQIDQSLKLRAEFIKKSNVSAEAQLSLELRKVEMNVSHEQAPELLWIERDNANDTHNGRDDYSRNAWANGGKRGEASG